MRSKTETRRPRNQLAWFRWEFLHRNKSYQREQEGFQAQFGDWFEANGYWWDQHGPIYSKQSLYFLSSHIAPAARAICERWRIEDPFPASWDFDVNGMRREGRTTLFLPTLLSCAGRSWNWPAGYPDTEAGFLDATKDIPDVIEPSWYSTTDPRLVRIEIDLQEPTQQILASIQSFVEQKKSYYERRIGLLPDHYRNPKIRLDQYATYLEVWELRQQRRSFEDIATELLPREMERARSRDSVVKRVRIHYKRACELIEEGYRQMKV